MTDDPSTADLEARIDDLETTAEGALQIAQNALQQQSELKARIEELESENDRLEFRIAELELKSDEQADKEYKLLTREEKHDRIIDDLLRRAQAVASGKAKVEYSDVMHGTFDSKPSPDHCYTLMKEVGERPGFQYNEPTGAGNIHLRVDLSDVTESLAAKANTEFSRAKKEGTEEAD
jgi:uncharacterized coiled-coil protein SlyX